ncbi:MFS transporter [Bacillus sp. HMF5848]|uniref:MFS transporter n=1 Tax=Bacillus sp. HMF5848 TaxID=2495421 RepID=UPI000F7676A3|nr:MFS transporter [Bacillus sp. HMF5848]RSK28465.1 MFS transporter [Bacillus sp. HMF5848]
MTAFYKEWQNQFSSYNKNVRLYLMVLILTQVAIGMFMIIYNFYIRELGYVETVNGRVISMTALASAIILIPAGIISDRTNRRNVMILGLMLTGGTLIVRSLMEAEPLLLATAFMTGLSMAFLQVSSIPWLAENSTQSQRIHLFSFNAALMTAAQVVGNLLGGVLTDIFTFAFHVPALLSIRITLLIAGVIFLLALIPLLRMKPVKKERSVKSRINTKIDVSQLKIILIFAVAQLIIGFGAGLVVPYLNLYFADRFQASNSVIGLILSLGQGATAFAMIIGPTVVKKLGEVRSVVLLQLLSLPFLLLTAYTTNIMFAAIGFLFRQALMNAGNPIMQSLLMERVDDSAKGLANSVNQMVFSLGWAVMGPVSTAFVMVHGSYWGYAIVFTITAGLYLVGSTYFYFMVKNTIQPQREVHVKII